MYAFVHVPKTGGRLMKKYLRYPYCADLCPESNLAPHQPVSWFEQHDHDHIFMTMVRDPYDRASSEYFYTKKQLMERSAKSINPHFGDITDTWLKNYAKRCGSVYSHYFNSRKVEDFDFVGNMHNMKASIDLANIMFGLNIQHEEFNVNPNHEVNKPYDEGYLRSEFEKENSKDYEIYFRGLEKFEELCRQYLRG
jgi:hypothetical protein